MKNGEREILNYIANNKECSSKSVFDGIESNISYATVKRILSKLANERLITTTGQGKSTKYSISHSYKLFQPIDMDSYFGKEIDEREIIGNFNFELIEDILKNAELFTDIELERLNILQKSFRKNISKLTETEYRKEFERLAIDLSWKSSQIEGNTYTLLETERLLREKQTASGRTKEEAIMLLNHKESIDFLLENTDYFNPVKVSRIESIHSILTKELAIDRNIRKRRVGITGTNYKPLDNEFQIKEALINMCELVNKKKNVFEKALLLLVLISYIQPFNDGNKRTARIVSNAVLMDHKYCPISFRTVDSIDYKKAMLLFYEQNNVSHFKRIFIDQFEFAVKTYF